MGNVSKIQREYQVELNLLPVSDWVCLQFLVGLNQTQMNRIDYQHLEDQIKWWRLIRIMFGKRHHGPGSEVRK